MKESYHKYKRLTSFIQKLTVTILVVVAYRIGSQIPSPAVNLINYKRYLENSEKPTAIIDLGASSVYTIFGIGIMPVLSSMLLLGLISRFIPSLKELQGGGPAGMRRYLHISRRFAFGIAFITAVISGITNVPDTEKTNGVSLPILDYGVIPLITHIVVLLAGFALLLSLAEIISRYGIGNGLMILTVVSVIAQARLPLTRLINQPLSTVAVYIIVLSLSVLILVYASQSRRVTPLYSIFPQANSNVPSNVHVTKIAAGSAGPVLFASATITSLSIFTNILPQNWVITGAIQSATRGHSNLALLVFAVVTIIFARTYASISNDPVELANSTTKSGSFILGVSPGLSTARYFSGLNSAMGWGYSIVIIPIMFFPILLQSVTGISSFALLGGSLFIPVLVISEIVDGILIQRKDTVKSTKII